MNIIIEGDKLVEIKVTHNEIAQLLLKNLVSKIKEGAEIEVVGEFPAEYKYLRKEKEIKVGAKGVESSEINKDDTPEGWFEDDKYELKQLGEIREVHQPSGNTHIVTKEYSRPTVGIGWWLAEGMPWKEGKGMTLQQIFDATTLDFPTIVIAKLRGNLRSRAITHNGIICKEEDKLYYRKTPTHSWKGKTTPRMRAERDGKA